MFAQNFIINTQDSESELEHCLSCKPTSAVILICMHIEYMNVRMYEYMIISYIHIHFSIYGINTNSQLTSSQLA